jgi:hypothetical protein
MERRILFSFWLLSLRADERLAVAVTKTVHLHQRVVIFLQGFHAWEFLNAEELVVI